jgi:hypothetical protein
MDRGLDIYDASAKTLSVRYKAYKKKKVGSELRDLRLTGRMRRGMRPLYASTNTVTIGFSDAEALNRAKINNRIVQQYGVSPTNQDELVKAIREVAERPVRIAIAS